jgi:hypothetical protein
MICVFSCYISTSLDKVTTELKKKILNKKLFCQMKWKYPDRSKEPVDSFVRVYHLHLTMQVASSTETSIHIISMYHRTRRQLSGIGMFVVTTMTTSNVGFVI